MSTLLVFVADAYHTDASRALLGCLQRVARRKGRKVQAVLSSVASSHPELLGGSDEVVLLLLEQQRAAAERLLAWWQDQAQTRRDARPALPLLVRTNTPEPLGIEGKRLSAPVAIDNGDIYPEHGGLVHLDEQAEEEMSEALTAWWQSGRDEAEKTIGARCVGCRPSVKMTA
jgi:hypothetical protein